MLSPTFSLPVEDEYVLQVKGRWIHVRVGRRPRPREVRLYFDAVFDAEAPYAEAIMSMDRKTAAFESRRWRSALLVEMARYTDAVARHEMMCRWRTFWMDPPDDCFHYWLSDMESTDEFYVTLMPHDWQPPKKGMKIVTLGD